MATMTGPTDAARAAELDAADPLAAFRERFVIDDPEVVYLDGNSLGRLPRATLDRLAAVARDEWGGELIRGWDHWLGYPSEVGERLAPLIGAGPGETTLSRLHDRERLQACGRGARRPA